MKALLNKTENWLLIAPFILSIIYYISNGNQVADLHFVDTYFIIDDPVLTLLLLSLLLLIIPFVMHLLLRRFKLRNIFIAKLHVILTIIILSAFYFLTTPLQTPPQFEVNTSSFRFTAENLLALFVTLQIVFVLYSIIVLIISSIKHSRTSVRRNDA